MADDYGTYQFTTRGTSEPDNMRAQVKDLQIMIDSLQKRLAAVADGMEAGIKEWENGGITQETCYKVTQILKKFHARIEMVSGRAWVLHHSMQGLLPEGVSEGNKC